ncbi:MAG: polysaccharide deacetylase family protein [bacterium]
MILILIIFLTSCTNTQTVYLNIGNVYSFDNTNEKIIYLTFDDGYPYANTLEIVNILNSYNIKCTFFLEGNFMADCTELIYLMFESGHIIANHTYTHCNITTVSNKKLLEEFTKFENLYFEITNTELIKYFRPPEGKYTNDKIEYIESLGYDIFFWSVNFKDWDRSNDLGETYAYNYITNNSSNGDIILMHTLTNSNVKALPNIIEYFLKEGFEFKNLDYLVDKRQNVTI